jgi:hypothetical protein
MNEEFDRFEEHMANEELEPYVIFAKHMEERFPKMFTGKYGGFSCGEGWWPILESLCAHIQTHIDWQNKNHENYPVVPQVVVAQIKEKFGGLRFYYEGGDDQIYGMVRMAESWAGHSCEECGAPGTSGGKGWIKTLCPTHRAESDARYEERFKDDKDLQKSILEGMLGEAE